MQKLQYHQAQMYCSEVVITFSFLKIKSLGLSVCLDLIKLTDCNAVSTAYSRGGFIGLINAYYSEEI